MPPPPRSNNNVLRLLQANQEDLDALQAVYEACPDYFERCLGGAAGPAEAQSSFSNLPPGHYCPSVACKDAKIASLRPGGLA